MPPPEQKFENAFATDPFGDTTREPLREIARRVISQPIIEEQSPEQMLRNLYYATPPGAVTGALEATERGSPVEALLNLLEFVPGGKLLGAVAGHLRGMKRLPPLFHGTRGPEVGMGEEAARRIAEQGFTSGKSAELLAPGTSVSRDPLLSLKRFADVESPEAMLRVTPLFGSSDVMNLRPSAYVLGEVPTGPAYGKPNLFYKEDEIFTLRTGEKAPLEARMLTAQERKSLQQAANKASELNDIVFDPDIKLSQSLRAYRELAPYKAAQVESAEWLIRKLKDPQKFGLDAPKEVTEAIAKEARDLAELQKDLEKFSGMLPGERLEEMKRIFGSREGFDRMYSSFFKRLEALVTRAESIAAQAPESPAARARRLAEKLEQAPTRTQRRQLPLP